MRKRKFHRPGGAEAGAEAYAEAYAAACPSHGRGVFFSRAGDYQIAPKPPGGRLWVVYPAGVKVYTHKINVKIVLRNRQFS